MVDFVNALKLGDGSISTREITFQCFMEGMWFACCSTTLGMHYEEDTKELWHCIGHVSGKTTIRLLSGPKNTGQILSEEAMAGCYDPTMCKVNFPIPFEGILRQVSTQYSRMIMPGVLEPVVDMAEEESGAGIEFILGLDWKLIVSGILQHGFGQCQPHGKRRLPQKKC